MTESDERPDAADCLPPRLPPGAALSHWSAVRRLGLPGRSAHGPHVTVRPDGRRPQRNGLRVHVRELPETDVVEVGGVRTTGAERTYLDLAELLRPHELVAVGDAVLRHGLATAESLAARVAASPRRRGVVTARNALALLDPRARSPAESYARYWIVRSGLPWPGVDHPVRDRFGRVIGRCSLAYADVRVGLDYVPPHRFGPPFATAGSGTTSAEVVEWVDAEVRAQVDRYTAMVSAGWCVLRFCRATVRDEGRILLARLASALGNRLSDRMRTRDARLPWVDRSPSPTHGRTSE